MSRLTAWIASRRQARCTARTPQANAVRGAAARPLRFERYEERIALSTNAAVDLPSMEPHVFYVDHVDVQEGGFVNFSSLAGNYTYVLVSGSATSQKAASDAAYYRGFAGPNLKASIALNSIWAEPTASASVTEIPPKPWRPTAASFRFRRRCRTPSAMRAATLP
jgi:hypothetical protein